MRLRDALGGSVKRWSVAEVEFKFMLWGGVPAGVSLNATYCSGFRICLLSPFSLSFLIGCRVEVQVCRVGWLIDFPCSGRYGFELNQEFCGGVDLSCGAFWRYPCETG